MIISKFGVKNSEEGSGSFLRKRPNRIDVEGFSSSLVVAGIGHRNQVGDGGNNE
jgi:hypothetical protein